MSSLAFVSAAETICYATQDKSQCSVSLGGTVYIQITADASSYDVKFKASLSSDPNVFIKKKTTVIINERFKNRTQFFTNNGTLKMANVEKSDSAQYTFEIHNNDGLLLRNGAVHLDVQGKYLIYSHYVRVKTLCTGLQNMI